MVNDEVVELEDEEDSGIELDNFRLYELVESRELVLELMTDESVSGKVAELEVDGMTRE